MICKNCGNEIDDGLAFCPKCGTALSADPQVKAQSAHTSGGGETKKQFPVKLIVIAVAAIILLLVIVSLVSNRKTTVNLNEYVNVKYEGYDGYGEASAYFDEGAFISDYADKITLSKKGKDELGKALEEITMYYGYSGDSINDAMILYYFFIDGKGDLDRDDSLKNGDQIEWKWNIDNSVTEKIEKLYKCKLVYEDMPFTVEGLEEIGTFDPFEGLEVSFSGIAPDGTAEITEKPRDGVAQSLSYEIEPRKDLSNGDEVTVSIDLYSSKDINEYCAEHYGMVPVSVKKTFTVSGLSSYVAGASEIPDDMMDKMKKQAEDVFNAYVAKEWGDKEDAAKLDQFDYIGNYFLSRKSGVGYGDMNVIYLVYHGVAKLDYDNEDKDDHYHDLRDFYYCVGYKNMMIMDDGTCSLDLSSYDVPYASFTVDTGISRGIFTNVGWVIKGYENLDTAFNKLVTSNIDSYEYENNVNQ